MSDVTIQELRAEAKRRGVSGAGSKDELRARLADPAPDPIPDPIPDPAPVSRQARGVEVARRSVVAWWCPVCDHSNHARLEVCGGCSRALVDGRVI